MKWEEYKKKYSAGEKGMSGKYIVFKVFWDVVMKKHKAKPYRLTCSLPGIIEDLDRFETPEEAKVYAERVFYFWLEQAGLEVREDEDQMGS